MAANSMSKKRRRPEHICCSDKGVGSSRPSGGTLKYGSTRKLEKGKRETGSRKRKTGNHITMKGRTSPPNTKVIEENKLKDVFRAEHLKLVHSRLRLISSSHNGNS